jgi:chromatin segregation and condensation protein Rec8/ScpA/Scc1 (kleisin family)
LFVESTSRSEIVAIFLAVLELVRNNEVGFESVDGRIVLSSQGE